MTYTNTGLVEHAQKALALKTRYMWGGILRLVEKQYNNLYKIYGCEAGTGYTPERWAELKKLFGKGYYGVDCVGLIKSYYWSGKENGGVGSPDYVGGTDVSATYMYQAATSKGTITTMPETPGLIVYSKTHPHVGIYIGNGYTIESTLGARGDGVVKRKLDSFWEYWFECPFIDYDRNVNNTQAVKLAFNAAIRDIPSSSGKKLGELAAGSKCVIIKNSETIDLVSKYIYVRLAGDTEKWIVKSAIK